MEASEVKETTYRIPEENLESLTNSFEKLNRKAVKNGIEPFSWKILNKVYETYTLDDGEEAERAFLEIKIEGKSPVIEGWKFVGTLERIDDLDKNLIKSAPGENIPPKYFEAKPVCDHCKINRYRHNTYIIRHVDTGEYKQVGGSCLKDFLATNQAERLIFMASYLKSIDDIANSHTGTRGIRIKSIYDLEKFLVHAAAAIRTFGWMSAGKAKEINDNYGDAWSTASIANYNFHRRWRFAKSTEPTPYRIDTTDEDVDYAKAAIEYMKTQCTPDSIMENSYLYNINTMLETGKFVEGSEGFAASIAGGYSRYLFKQQEAKRALIDKTKSKHFGEEKQRYELIINVDSVREYNTTDFMGNEVINAVYTMHDSEGNCFNWFTGRNVMDADHKYKIKGTVKSHGEYNGELQTTLTRCKVIEEL